MKNRRKRCQKAAQEPPIWHLKTGLPPQRERGIEHKPIEITPDMTNPELVKKIRELNRDAKLSLVVKPSNLYLKRKICRKNRQVIS